MNRSATLLMALVLVVASAAVVPAAAIQSSASASSAETAASAQTNNSSIQPGERLSGVVGVQEAEIDGEVESRAFGIKIAKAASNDSKAQIVAQEYEENQERVEELEARLEELKQARENGSISDGEFAARAAQIQAKLNNVERMSNQSAEVAEGLPEDTLRANGVNVTAIKMLRERAANMTGPEVAAIAQTIAGPPSDKGLAAGDRKGGPQRGNQTAAGDRGGSGPQTDGNQTDADGGETPDDPGPQSGQSGQRG